MQAQVSSPPNSQGHLVENLLHFGRLLRGLGMRISTREVYDLAEGLTHIDITRRNDFYHASASFLVHNPDELEMFRQAFDLFWAGRVEWMIEFGMGRQRRPAEQDELESLPTSEQKVIRQMGADRSALDEAEEPDGPEETRLSATYSPTEHLHRKDFSDFDEEELEAAKRFIHSLVWQLDTRLTRRQVRAAKRARTLDLPRVIRGSMKQGGEIVRLAWRRRKAKPRPLVVICDISGSMERYSRLFLHFMYAMVQDVRHIEAFVFGTRLTRITPALRYRDVDSALSRMSDLVTDWSGGTRIGESLKTFNYEWARRVLGGGAVAIIISDGWDRGDVALLEQEISRLRRSVSRLIWLNPLLGAPEYQPLVRGIRAALPYVDDFLPLNNLLSLEGLALQIGSLTTARRRALINARYCLTAPD